MAGGGAGAGGGAAAARHAALAGAWGDRPRRDGLGAAFARAAPGPPPPPPSEESVESLMNLGFDRSTVLRALEASGNNLDAAANRLLQ